MPFSLCLALPTVVLVVTFSVSATASPILLTFDGAGGNLAQFYNGGIGSNGPGPNYGVEFLSGSIGNPCLQSALSPLSCLPDPPAMIPGGEVNCPVSSVTCTTMNVAGGFTNQLGFQFIAPTESILVAIYSDVNAGGTLLAQIATGVTVDFISNIATGGYAQRDIPFAGIARSVQFVQNGVPFSPGGFDDIAIDRLDAVPEPATLGSLAAGLFTLILARRRTG